MSETKWTPKKIAFALEAWNLGHSANKISKMVNERFGTSFTKNAVGGMATRHNFPPRESPIKYQRAPNYNMKSPRPKPEKRDGDPEIPPNTRKTRVDEWAAYGISDKPCKFPIGHPGDDDYHSCGAGSVIDKPYCPDHCAVSFVRPLAKRAA